MYIDCLYVGICEDGQLRLAGVTATARSGRVEVCFNETWGTICDSFWTVNDGRVACRQLGFSKLSMCLYILDKVLCCSHFLNTTNCI